MKEEGKSATTSFLPSTLWSKPMHFNCLTEVKGIVDLSKLVQNDK